MPRSKKPAMKHKMVKKDNTDQETKDHKEYLDPSLFHIYQQIKKMDDEFFFPDK